MTEIYTILLGSTLVCLLAFWLLIRLVLRGQEEIEKILQKIILAKLYDLETQIAHLRFNIITSGDRYWLDKRLREESESRL